MSDVIQLDFTPDGILSRLSASPVGIAILIAAIVINLAVPRLLHMNPNLTDERRETIGLIVRIVGLGLALLAFALIISANP